MTSLEQILKNKGKEKDVKVIFLDEEFNEDSLPELIKELSLEEHSPFMAYTDIGHYLCYRYEDMVLYAKICGDPSECTTEVPKIMDTFIELIREYSHKKKKVFGYMYVRKNG